MVKISEATVDDIEDIIKTCSVIPEDNNMDQWFPVDTKDTFSILHELLSTNQGSGYVLRDEEKDDILVGVIILAIDKFWWSSQRFATNVLFWVHPEYRKITGTSLKLIRTTKIWSDQTGIPVIIQQIGTENLDKYQRLMKMFGFTPLITGSIYSPE